MYCENCGTKIPDGSQFCPECGAPVRIQNAQRTNVRSQKPVRKIGGKGIDQKKLLIPAVAVAMVIVVLIVVIGSGNSLSSKFKKAAGEMQNQWPGSVATYYNITDTRPLPTSWPDLNYASEVKSAAAYEISGNHNAFFLLVEFRSSSDCDSVMASYGDDSEYEPTSDGYVEKIENDFERVDRKGNYILVSDYTESTEGPAVKFISEAGF